MTRRTKRIARGQSTAEYAIVIALVLGAAIAMQTFVRRTIQGRVADGASSMPLININRPAGVNVPANLAANGNLYEPQYAASISNANTNVSGNATLTGAAGGTSNVNYTANTVTNRNGLSVEAGAN